jgi:hypothetical protein
MPKQIIDQCQGLHLEVSCPLGEGRGVRGGEGRRGMGSGHVVNKRRGRSRTSRGDV